MFETSKPRPSPDPARQNESTNTPGSFAVARRVRSPATTKQRIDANRERPRKDILALRMYALLQGVWAKYYLIPALKCWDILIPSAPRTRPIPPFWAKL